MARPLWRGTLSFGLVSIPVEMHTAVRDPGPHFHFLRRSDKSRISYSKVVDKDSGEVSKDELVKGYEYEKGRYVVLTTEDFESAAVERNSRIDVLDFVDGQEIDDRYFDKPYYLLPGKGGEQSYAVFRNALRESGRLGIAKFVMRNRPHLAAVEAIEHLLVLSTMRFRDELVAASKFEVADATARKSDMKIAHQLIEALAGRWDPKKYTDEYRGNLMAIIEAKRKRQKPELERQEPKTNSNVVNLMERLRQSLDQAQGRKRTAGRRAKAKRSKRAA